MIFNHKNVLYLINYKIKNYIVEIQSPQKAKSVKKIRRMK